MASGGSGGGTEYFGGGKGGDSAASAPASCRNVASDTLLRSPKEAVISKFEVGAELQLRHGQGTSIEALYRGEVAGGIVLPDLQERLIECLDQGVQFEARVDSKEGARVALHIRATA